MTVADLLQGAWTWGALLREVYPVLLPTIPAFLLGYERGRRAEARARLAQLP